MNEFYRNIFDALIMLDGLEKDLNIRHFSPNELKVFYTIVTQNALNEGDSNISEIVNCSGMSRSTVYKTLKNYPMRELLISLSLKMMEENL